jgi:hypothetical protein
LANGHAIFLAIQAKNSGLALRRPNHIQQYALCRRLARPVWPQKAKHLSFLHR